MTSHPLSNRVNPYVWLVLQAASVVASILLAFAIDAWWGQRVEAAAKNELLEDFRKELMEQRKALDTERVYREASRDSVKSLLAAVASGRYEDNSKTLDHRLADLLWFTDAPESSGLLEALLQGGRIAAIEDETLRRKLADWPAWLRQYSSVSRQEYQTYTDVLLPFLARHASLAQISNAGYVHGRPGDGWGADPEAIVPVGPVTDHSDLLRNQEFAGIVVRKLFIDSDIMLTLDRFGAAMTELVQLIDQELASTT